MKLLGEVLSDTTLLGRHSGCAGRCISFNHHVRRLSCLDVRKVKAVVTKLWNFLTAKTVTIPLFIVILYDLVTDVLFDLVIKLL